MLKCVLKPLQILKLSFVIKVAQRRMLRFNVLIFVSVGIVTAAARKSEGNLCASGIFNVFVLNQALLIPSTVAFWLSRVNLALNLV